MLPHVERQSNLRSGAVFVTRLGQATSLAWKNRVTRSIASDVIGSGSEKSKPWALPG